MERGAIRPGTGQPPNRASTAEPVSGLRRLCCVPTQRRSPSITSVPRTGSPTGEYLDAGETTRRHVRVAGVEHIGKEANRWEERFFVDDDPDAQVSYGLPNEHRKRQRSEIVEMIRSRGVRRVARESGLSVGLVSGIAPDKRAVSSRSMQRLRSCHPSSSDDSTRAISSSVSP